MSRQSWLDRATIPDKLPHDDGYGRPGYVQTPGIGVGGQFGITPPGQRPFVYQAAVSTGLNVGTTAVPLSNAQNPIDGVILSVPDGGTEVWIGYGSGIQVGGGMLVPAGGSRFLSPDNTRELWELQRTLEMLAGIDTTQNGLPALPLYRAPRVVLDLSKYYAIASGAQVLGVLAFYVPEGQ